MSELVAVPWWVTRIRHGSLFQKRLGYYLVVACVGLTWFLGDINDLWLSYLMEYEGKLYSSRVVRLWAWLIGAPIPDNPVVAPLYGWLDLIGDIGFFIATTWACLWIFCDCFCKATEVCNGSEKPSRGLQRALLYRYFFRTVGVAVLVAVATYGIAWQVFKATGGYDWVYSLIDRPTQDDGIPGTPDQYLRINDR